MPQAAFSDLLLQGLLYDVLVVLVLESIKTNLKANIASKETAPKLVKMCNQAMHPRNWEY